MSLALVFSIVAARSMVKLDQGSSKSREFGVNYAWITLYHLPSLFTNAGIMNFILLVDVWTIPLLVLGIALLYENRLVNLKKPGKL
jgi:hypothetical protein